MRRIVAIGQLNARTLALLICGPIAREMGGDIIEPEAPWPAIDLGDVPVYKPAPPVPSVREAYRPEPPAVSRRGRAQRFQR